MSPSRWVLLALAGLLIVTPASPRAAEEEAAPVWDRVRFGMSPKDLRELYPDLGESTKPESEALPVSKIALGSQSFGPLDNCLVEFQLLSQALVQMTFFCVGHDPRTVRSALEQRYGYAQSEDARDVVWEEGNTHVSLNPNSGFFSISDKRRGAAAVRNFLGPGLIKLGQEQQQRRSDTTPKSSPERPAASPEGDDPGAGGASGKAGEGAGPED